MGGKTRVLFLSRAFPPVVGGMENQNFALSVRLPEVCRVRTIANVRGKLFLPLFLPYAILAAWLLRARYDVLLLGDGVLSPVGYIASKLLRKPVVCVVHGLDITYSNRLYRRFWVRVFLKASDRIIAVGRETVRVGMAAGIPAEKFVFIPNGIERRLAIDPPVARKILEERLGEDLSGHRLLLTTGRLVRRKGVAWFVEHVLPNLPEEMLYIVAGKGEERSAVERAARRAGVEHRVRLPGFVSDELRDLLLHACDCFVQPNIPVPGTMEGFGIAVLEAASCGLPVVASDLEGLKDAVIDGVSGRLVPPGNPEKFAEAVRELLADETFRRDFGKKASEFVLEHCTWEKIVRRYAEILAETALRQGS